MLMHVNKASNLEVCHVMHRPDHKGDDLRWFPVTALPDNTVRYVREAIALSLAGTRYSEFGW